MKLPADKPALSEEEIYLRVATPVFFEDLISARTASLLEQADPEKFAAWKEERLQKDRLFAAVSADALLQVNEQRQSSSFEMQSIEFAGALTRFAAEAELPLERQNLSPEQAMSVYSKIIQEEWAWNADLSMNQEQEIPPEDMRFVAAREIQESKVRHHEETNAVRHSFGEMSQVARDEFLEEQRQAGQEALKAQQQSLQQTRALKLIPPKQSY